MKTKHKTEVQRMKQPAQLVAEWRATGERLAARARLVVTINPTYHERLCVISDNFFDRANELEDAMMPNDLSSASLRGDDAR
jgi:hypothetical protein